jgi:hypothetical protein
VIFVGVKPKMKLQNGYLYKEKGGEKKMENYVKEFDAFVNEQMVMSPDIPTDWPGWFWLYLAYKFELEE